MYVNHNVIVFADQMNKNRIEKLKKYNICFTFMKKLFLRTSFFTSILLLFLVTSADNAISLHTFWFIVRNYIYYNTIYTFRVYINIFFRFPPTVLILD